MSKRIFEKLQIKDNPIFNALLESAQKRVLNELRANITLTFRSAVRHLFKEMTVNDVDFVYN